MGKSITRISELCQEGADALQRWPVPASGRQSENVGPKASKHAGRLLRGSWLDTAFPPPRMGPGVELGRCGLKTDEKHQVSPCPWGPEPRALAPCAASLRFLHQLGQVRTNPACRHPEPKLHLHSERLSPCQSSWAAGQPSWHPSNAVSGSRAGLLVLHSMSLSLELLPLGQRSQVLATALCEPCPG